jgi:hypothetical protein
VIHGIPPIWIGEKLAKGIRKARFALTYRIERNLESLRPRLTEDEYWKLKLLVHTHDTFKAEARAGVAITDPQSHASIARDFLSTYCSDGDLLMMVQYHDEPFGFVPAV